MSDFQEFGILGTVAMCRRGVESPIPTRRARTVLACLCLAGDAIVDTATVISALYPERGPESARNQVHRGVSELRQAGVSIESIGSSYRLDPSARNLDSVRFERFVLAAETATIGGDQESAFRLYGSALSVPRGPVLGGVDGPYFEPFRDFWTERIMAVEEGRARMSLLLGHHEDILPRLMLLRSQAPLRETLVGYLMVGMYCCGRSREALGLYVDFREEMAASLGVEPDPCLRKIHVGILRQVNPEVLLHRVVHYTPGGYESGSSQLRV